MKASNGIHMMIAMLAGMLLVSAVTDCLAVQPYKPVHPDPVLEPWRWTVFPELRGLGLRCMTEDLDGRMWFGVDDGVRVYDGYEWKTYRQEDGIFGRPVQVLLCAKDGTVYAGTRSGISAFKDGAWRRVFPKNDDHPWAIVDLEEGLDGAIWAGTMWGALRIGREQIGLYTSSEMKDALTLHYSDIDIHVVPDSIAVKQPWPDDDEMGVLSLGGLVWKVASGSPADRAGVAVGDLVSGLGSGRRVEARVKYVNAIDSSEKIIRNRAGHLDTLVLEKAPFVSVMYEAFSVRAVCQDRNGAVWFGLSAGEIVRLSPNREATGKEEWVRFTEADGLEMGSGPTIEQTRDGRIWVVSSQAKRGVNWYDGKVWRNKRLATWSDAPPPDFHLSLAESHDGTLWIGGHWGTLNALSQGNWRMYRPRSPKFPKSDNYPIPIGRLSDLHVASDGALWMIGLGRQAVRLDLGYSKWQTFQDLVFLKSGDDGEAWFRDENDSTLVQRLAHGWYKHSVDDGPMQNPMVMLSDPDGGLLVVGRQNGLPALSKRSGESWDTQILPSTWRPGQGIGSKGCFIEPDGTIWLGQGIGLRFDGTEWQVPFRPHAYFIKGTPDGSLWFGGGGLLRRKEGRWSRFTEPEALASWMICAETAADGSLWVGTRAYGVLQFDGQTWHSYSVLDGLPGNSIVGIKQTSDGSIWVGIGMSERPEAVRFDGQTWVKPALPSGFTRLPREETDGVMWLYSNEMKSDVRYVPDRNPPHTRLTRGADTVPHGSMVAFAWTGSDYFNDTPEDQILFSWRIDDRDWSPYNASKIHTFDALGSGDHRFEVRARDRDFNVDPDPAVVIFSVLPPTWQQPWFIAMVLVLVGAIGFQTSRVVRRDRRLQESNVALSDGNKELFRLNRTLEQKTQDLERERATDRIRAEVQNMETSTDFDSGVLARVSEDLRTADLTFDAIGIDVLDEPVDVPTMAYFEANGFRYTTYTIEADGAVTRESYQLSAPFPALYRTAIERFAAGQVWQGRDMDLGAMAEVPIAQYGRLRVTSSTRQVFSEDDIATLQEFASAIALGYARYLDIREIQEQTERKSKFLASMSHELRTPMNAIMGFTSMVLRRSGDALPERQRGNLEKVLDAANRLLGLINGLLDLSKIEAGRMDVDVKRFRVDTLVRSCCAEIEPLVTEKAAVDLVCEVDDGVGEVETDEGRVRQIVTNLLSNAIKFTEQGQVTVRVRGEADCIEIAVSDTGAGIPQDALDTIFEEFQQVKGSDTERKGTGLGLPICKGFAELLGGSIRVESEVGKGSTFTVRLPVNYAVQVEV